MATVERDLTLEVKKAKESDKIQFNPSTTSSSMKDIIEKALLSDNPLLQKALKQEQEFRRMTEMELDDLLNSLRKSMSEREMEQIRDLTLKQLDRDLDLVGRLNAALNTYNAKDTQPKDYSEADKNTCTFPLKFNKMALAIPGAKTFVSAHFEDVFCQNKLPQGYAYHSKPGDVTVLGNNPFSIYGDSKGTFLKTAAITASLICNGKRRLQDVLSIDNSALVHVTHLPNSLDLGTLGADFEKFSYLFSDDVTPKGFSFVHSGYSFGGQRDTLFRYADTGGTKRFGPEDCSSWIAKFCGSPVQFSTIDQLYVYRLRMLQDFKLSLGQIPSNYDSTPVATTMSDLFDPVVVKDPQRDIQPGQIYAYRNFDLVKDPSKEGPGGGGHTGMVVDFVNAGKDSNIVIFAYNRDMPNVEGFGLQTVPFAPENRKVMLFSLKSQKAIGGKPEKQENKEDDIKDDVKDGVSEIITLAKTAKQEVSKP